MKSDPLGPAQIAANHARIARGMMMRMMGRDEGHFEFAWSAYLNEHDRAYTLIFSALNDDPKGANLFKKLRSERKNDELLNWLRVARNLRTHSAAIGTDTSHPSSVIQIGPLAFAHGGKTFLTVYEEAKTGQPPKPYPPPEVHKQRSIRNDWKITDLFGLLMQAITTLETTIDEARKALDP